MLDKTYDPKEIEARLYPEWEKSGAFRADPASSKPPYCIVIPSPNVTGRLHMGHARDHPLRYLLGGVLMGKLRPGYRRLTLGARATLSR